MTALLIRGGREIWLNGPDYLTALAGLHARLAPKRYFEIGTLHGETLALSRCASVAVDPCFQLTVDVHAGKPSCLLFEQTSDAFFSCHDLGQVLGGPFDLAFLDGLHRFEFLLRDFINTELHGHPGSTVVMHDCIPRDADMVGRDDGVQGKRSVRYPHHWAGDVWKIVPALKSVRPDLRFTCLDAPPTGLVVCEALDPHSRVLRDRYDDLVSTWASADLKTYGLRRLFEEAKIQSAAAWLDAISPFRHPQPVWKRLIKRGLHRP